MNNKAFKETEYYLYNHKNLEALNNITDIKIKALKNDISLRAIGYEEKTGPTNKFNSDVENEVIRRDKIITPEIEKLELEKNKRNMISGIIDNFLMTLDEYQKQIIELRYFTKPKTSWVSIAQKLNKSEPQCQRDKNQLIDQLYKLINR